MIFGLKKIPHRLIFMSYDDVETPTAMIGKKLAPILHLHGEDPFPESLDIIKRVDEDAILGTGTGCWENCPTSTGGCSNLRWEELVRWPYKRGIEQPSCYAVQVPLIILQLWVTPNHRLCR